MKKIIVEFTDEAWDSITTSLYLRGITENISIVEEALIGIVQAIIKGQDACRIGKNVKSTSRVQGQIEQAAGTTPDSKAERSDGEDTTRPDQTERAGNDRGSADCSASSPDDSAAGS